MTFAELRDFIKSYYMTWATKRALNELIDLVEAGSTSGEEFPVNDFSLFAPVPNATTHSFVGSGMTATGTSTAAAIGATTAQNSRPRANYAAAAATTAVAGLRDNAKYLTTRTSSPIPGWVSTIYFGPSTGSASNATKRCFVGVCSTSNVAPTDIEIDGAAIVSGVGVGHSTSETNLHIKIARNGVITHNVDCGSAFTKAVADATAYYKLVITNTVVNEITVELTDITTGTIFSQTFTTNLPDQLMGVRAHYSVGGTNSAIGIAIGKVYTKLGIF